MKGTAPFFGPFFARPLFRARFIPLRGPFFAHGSYLRAAPFSRGLRFAENENVRAEVAFEGELKSVLRNLRRRFNKLGLEAP